MIKNSNGFMKKCILAVALLFPPLGWAECDRTPQDASEQVAFEAEDKAALSLGLTKLSPYEHRVLANIYREKKSCQDLELKHRIGAAESNDVGDLTILGQEYVFRGDIDKAEYPLRKASDAGYGLAMRLLGKLYLNHFNKKQEALKWFKKAIYHGEVNAYLYIGWMYFNGDGIQQNINKGFNTWIEGARKGDSGSAASIADVYANGWYRARDLNEAKRWYNRAYELGCIECLDKIKQLPEQ